MPLRIVEVTHKKESPNYDRIMQRFRYQLPNKISHKRKIKTGPRIVEATHKKAGPRGKYI